MKRFTYHTIITRVLDGDSFYCEPLDLGHGVFLNKVVYRLYGVNTWESRTKNLKEKAFGLEAKRLVKDLIEGKEVRLTTIKPEKFGRMLAIVETLKPDGEVDFNLGDYLIKRGLAYAYFGEKKKEFEN